MHSEPQVKTIAQDKSPKNTVQGIERLLPPRRLFLKKTAITATLVAASIVGFDQFRDTVESISPKTINSAIAIDFSTLDAGYSTLGRSKIESYVANANPEIVMRTRMWIQQRGHISMYDLICQGLTSAQGVVANQAFVLLTIIDPVDLKGQVAVISDQMRFVQVVALKDSIEKLLVKIESS